MTFDEAWRRAVMLTGLAEDIRRRHKDPGTVDVVFVVVKRGPLFRVMGNPEEGDRVVARPARVW